jgi:hypothetical protein
VTWKKLCVFWRGRFECGYFQQFFHCALEQSRANLIKAELLGSGYQPLDLDMLGRE